MSHSIAPPSEEIIPHMLNCIGRECGGRMGGAANAIKCEAECRADWREVWERRLARSART
jgi:hypothetical protein